MTEEDEEDTIITDRDVIHAWDVDEEDTAGRISGQQFEELVLKLKGHMRLKKRARVETSDVDAGSDVGSDVSFAAD